VHEVDALGGVLWGVIGRLADATALRTRAQRQQRPGGVGLSAQTASDSNDPSDAELLHAHPNLHCARRWVTAWRWSLEGNDPNHTRNGSGNCLGGQRRAQLFLAASMPAAVILTTGLLGGADLGGPSSRMSAGPRGEQASRRPHEALQAWVSARSPQTALAGGRRKCGLG